MLRPWPKLSTQDLFSCPVFSLRRDRVQSPRTAKEMDVFVLDTGDWINVVPMTDADEVVLVRQWRHGTERVTLEVPGGLVDPSDRDPQEAAIRELREETGFAATDWTLIGTVEPNPAILSNVCYTFLASGAHRVAEQTLDGGEDIEIVLHPLADIPTLIDSGEIRHSLVVSAFAHLDRFNRRR